MKSIKIYGDSILKGVVYNEELKRYKLCKYRFDQLEEDGICVENNCKMGVTVEKGFEIMRATLGDCTKDDLVVMEFGGNDCNYDWKAVSLDPFRDHDCVTPEKQFLATYGEMIDFARSKGASVAVSTLVPIESSKFLRWVGRGLDTDRIMTFLGDLNMIARWQEYYSHLAERAAKAADCPVLDLRSRFLMSRKLSSMICEDGIHPTEEGHLLIRDTFQQEIMHDFVPAQ